MCAKTHPKANTLDLHDLRFGFVLLYFDMRY